MKKGFKRIGAFLLTAVMTLAMNSTVFAANLTGGEIGGFTSPDAPTSQEKTINIQKELTVYNVDETSINAPTISYTYTITPGAAGVSITDATTDHANNTAVTVQTKAGIIPGVSVTGSADGTANTVAAAGVGDAEIANTISWSPASTLTASTGGTANYQNLNIDFSGVVFGAAGVYRYVITETAPAYAVCCSAH